MRRSHRLALSALVALAVLAAAGRLAAGVARPGRATPAATAAPRARESARAAAAPARLAPAPTHVPSDAPPATPLRVATAAHPEAPDRAPARARHELRATAPIALDDPQPALGTAVAIHGRDPGAPRAIELWRVAGERAVRVAVGQSRSDGTLALPPLVLPGGDVTLVASPRGEGIASPNASAPVVASRDPSPPRLVARDDTAADTLVLQLEAAEPGGALVVARASEDEIGRAPVVAAADGARATLEVAIALAPDDAEVLVAQEVPGGRRSAWRRVVVNPQPRGE